MCFTLCDTKRFVNSKRVCEHENSPRDAHDDGWLGGAIIQQAPIVIGLSQQGFLNLELSEYREPLAFDQANNFCHLRGKALIPGAHREGVHHSRSMSFVPVYASQ